MSRISDPVWLKNSQLFICHHTKHISSLKTTGNVLSTRLNFLKEGWTAPSSGRGLQVHYGQIGCGHADCCRVSPESKISRNGDRPQRTHSWFLLCFLVCQSLSARFTWLCVFICLFIFDIYFHHSTTGIHQVFPTASHSKVCDTLKITSWIRVDHTLRDFLLHGALRVIMEPVFTRMGLKVAVLFLLTSQLHTGEWHFYLKNVA